MLSPIHHLGESGGMTPDLKLLTLDDLQEIVGNMNRLCLPWLRDKRKRNGTIVAVPANRFVRALFKREAYRRRVISDPEAFTTRYPQEVESNPLVGLQSNVLVYPNKQHPPSPTLERVPDDFPERILKTTWRGGTQYTMPQRIIARKNVPDLSPFKNFDLFVASLLVDHFAGVGATDAECQRSTPSETRRAVERRDKKRRRCHKTALQFAGLAFSVTEAAQDSMLASALGISARSVRSRRAELEDGAMKAARWQGMSEAARRDFWWIASLFGLEVADEEPSAVVCVY